jgi:long-chain acyl-CoA synthetase
MNLARHLMRSAQRLPGQPAVIERDRLEHTYAVLARRTLALATALRSRLGVAPGGRVALVMRNNAAYVELLHACWAAGAAAIPVNVKLHPKEVAFILDDADARVCFVTDDVDGTAIDAARAGGGTTFIDVDSRDYRALLHEAPAPLTEVAADDVAWLFYTSGTTGRPKGVMLTHRNLLAMTLNYLADVDPAAAGDHLLHAAPMSHGSGIYILPNIAAAATQLIPASRGFEVAEIDEILALVPKVKFFAAPTMLMRLVDGMKGEAQGLKSIVYGGGPMYVADCLRALDRLGPRLTQIYGQGEAPMTITVLPAAEHVDDHDRRRLQRLASVGRAQTGVELAVLGAGDEPLAEGEIGEVAVAVDVDTDATGREVDEPGCVDLERAVAVEDLWNGPGSTSALPGELCVGVDVPGLPAQSGSAYVRLEYRRAMEIAIVGASACVTLADDGTVAAAKVALTAVAPTIIRSPAAEQAILGTTGDDAALAGVESGASADARPISDLRGTDDYRRAMAGVIAKRAVTVALLRAGGDAFPIPATPVFMKGSGA